MRRLHHDEYDIFINTIGHSAKTTITIHLLRQDIAKVYIVGEPDNFTAALVFEGHNQEEPTGYGVDADAMWNILAQVDSWAVVNVEPALEKSLSTIMQREMSLPIRIYGDYYYQLSSPVEQHQLQNDAVEIRLLTVNDLEMVKSASDGLQPMGYGSVEASLAKGWVAGAIVNNQLVAMADSHRAETYINVGVFTHPDWRQQGLSTACASHVITKGQQARLIPVWSCGEDNYASQRVAEKLGYQKVDERIYVIPVRNQA